MRLFLLAALSFFIAGCSPCGGNAKDKIVAQINKYNMTAEDLRYEFKNAAYDEQELIKTKSGRREYLEELIDKEVLLQEAQRQGIDREKDFMKSIENHWEQALLKILLQRKSREISRLTHVYDNEVEDYYRSSGENAPFSKVKNEIKDILKQKKEEELMNFWIQELRNKSYIKVDENAAEEAFSNNR